MKRKKIVFILLIILGAVIFSLALYNIFVNIFGNKEKELSEIGVPVNKIEIEYRSERGFGNDRFDIYSFSLESKDEKVDFKLHDDNLEEIYKTVFKTILNSKSENNQKLRDVRDRIEALKQGKDLVYKYFIMEGTKKLYLYDRVLNKGYCLILTIW